jgi:anti-sigma B factor antagonist
MEVDIYQARTDLYFAVQGRIVLEECERFKNLCLPLINRGIDQVIVDLSKVDFIDSAGLGVLVGMKMTSSKNKARIVLLQPSRPVADILFISKLDGIFDIMTGAEADLLKSQLVQSHFRIGGTQAQAKTAERPVTADWMQSKLDTAYPKEQARATPVPTGEELRGQKDQIEEHCRRAVEFMRQGNYELSVQEYQKALSIDADYLPALNNLAIVYEKQPSWNNKAIEQWEHVLRLSQQRSDQKHVDRAQRHLANLRRMTA